MKHLAVLAIGLLAGASAASPAFAQEVIYRCGNEYTQRPCEGARELRPAPAPTEDEREAARTSHWRQSLMAEELAAERQKQEARPPGGPSAIRGRVGAADPQDSVRQDRDRPSRERAARAGRDDTFRAVVPGSKRGGSKS
ncbi:MAG TPA: hypothetical protein VNO84_03320 [Burkholderiaceae bacterium]|nr:hypothetical protein [Burkholderiaceae bacterium]